MKLPTFKLLGATGINETLYRLRPTSVELKVPHEQPFEGLSADFAESLAAIPGDRRDTVSARTDIAAGTVTA
jgi:hypothetical protein